MCGAPVQDLSLEGIDVAAETIIQGTVSRGGEPAGGAYVRLLDSSGEFTAEVVTSATGDFRFFAAPGDWTLSVLHKDGKVRQDVHASGPGLLPVSLSLQ